jgi:hypothetical protein
MLTSSAGGENKSDNRGMELMAGEGFAVKYLLLQRTDPWLEWSMLLVRVAIYAGCQGGC